MSPMGAKFRLLPSQAIAAWPACNCFACSSDRVGTVWYVHSVCSRVYSLNASLSIQMSWRSQMAVSHVWDNKARTKCMDACRVSAALLEGRQDVGACEHSDTRLATSLNVHHSNFEAYNLAHMTFINAPLMLPGLLHVERAGCSCSK